MLDDLEEKNISNTHHVHSMPPSIEKPDKETTLWQKIVGRFLPQADHTLKELANRFHEMGQDAYVIRTELETIRGELEGQVDHDLFILVKEVIDPLLREVDSIKAQSSASPEVLKRYSQWTTKASLWVHLYAKAGDEVKITQCIIQHIQERAIELINRDIKMILDDIEHSGKDQMKLLESVSPYIEQLEELKKNQEEIKLSEVSGWKNRLDTTRAKIVNNALQEIDKY